MLFSLAYFKPLLLSFLILQDSQNELNGHLLAAVLEALCHPSVRLTSVLPILKDRETETISHTTLSKQCSMEDSSPTVQPTECKGQFPELVAHMEQRLQASNSRSSSPTFQEVLDKLLNILTLPIRQLLDKVRML